MIAESGRWVRAGGRIVLLPGSIGAPFRGEAEEEVQAEAARAPLAADPLVCAPKVPKPPAGLRLLCHVHVSKTRGTPSAAPVPMDTAAMNPGFVDPATDALVVNTTATGLHTRLNVLIAAKHRAIASKIGVAVVDLTGGRLFAPELAGWRSTVAVTGASTPKVCALYAVHQLAFELQAMADRMRLATRAQLAAAAQAAWKARRLTSAQPDLALFTFTESPPRPVQVAVSSETEKVIECAFASNENRAASILISRVGLPYLSSLLWSSGLFHPRRGGMWLTAHYGTGCTHPEIPDCCFAKMKVPEHAPGAVAVTPRANTTKNLTALSAATFFTLMAQGRLADQATSDRIRKTLESACSFFGARRLPCARASAKCGTWGGFVHDVALVERRVGPGCTGKTIRYVVVLTTAQLSSPPFDSLLTDVDALIQQNNP